MRDSIKELVYLLKAKTKCIWIKSYEESSVVMDIKEILNTEFPNYSLNVWTLFSGIQKEPLNDLEKKEPPVLMSPEALFDKIIKAQQKGSISNESKEEGVYIIKDLHTFNTSPSILRGIRDAQDKMQKDIISYNPIIVISPIVSIPLEHEKLFTIIEYDLPTKQEVSTLINLFVNRMKSSNKYEIPTPEKVKTCIDLAYGLTLEEIKNILSRSLYKYNTISVEIFHDAKIELIKKTNILEYKKPSMTIEDMGGNKPFKEWINDIKLSMTPEAADFGVESSKGFLGLGIPGTSKTLSAEIIANELDLPMLKLNMSRIMHSHVGQSEKNIENAINVIKSCAPCVLLIDEAEKTLSGTGSSNKTDGGTLMRVVGKILEFLAEDNQVFTVMTSNDVTQLPPELSRSGRLDAIWYFSLPTEEERKEIFRIHFKKAKKEVSDDLIEYAARRTPNFTGAEIKDTVKIGIRKAFIRSRSDNNMDITEEDINNAINEIIIVYESYKEKILALEDYAKKRARFANTSIAESHIINMNDNYINIDDIH